jgi:TnpA family transposase
VTVYTHLSDQWSVYGTRIISCAAREALYVLDGLLENDTVLRPKEHYTDTHGFTEQLFGLCYLLGFQFMPRIKDLKDQQLYKVSRMTSYGPLDPVFRATVDLALPPRCAIGPPRPMWCSNGWRAARPPIDSPRR